MHWLIILSQYVLRNEIIKLEKKTEARFQGESPYEHPISITSGARSVALEEELHKSLYMHNGQVAALVGYLGSLD